MNLLIAFGLTTILLLLQTTARPEPKPCNGWQESFQVGVLPQVIDESSGLAVSRKYRGRMYHVNDSGDAGRLFITGMQGENVRSLQISGFKPRDVEALALGPCDGNKTCIFVADIGDNSRSRQDIEIAVIEEEAEFTSRIRPKYEITIRYPGGPEDAESLAVHPNGTIYILTKSLSPRLFKLPRTAWEEKRGQVHTLQSVMELRPGAMPTDMSISDDGNRFLVLTYLSAVEYDTNFTPRKIPVRTLPQQEAIAYLPGSRSLVYTTERARQSAAQIMRSDLCDGNPGQK